MIVSRYVYTRHTSRSVCVVGSPDDLAYGRGKTCAEPTFEPDITRDRCSRDGLSGCTIRAWGTAEELTLRPDLLDPVY